MAGRGFRCFCLCSEQTTELASVCKYIKDGLRVRKNGIDIRMMKCHDGGGGDFTLAMESVQVEEPVVCSVGI